MDNILEVYHVSKHFSSKTALDDVSLNVPRGSVYGLLGPNGAGKTTLIRIINYITAPDSGKIIFDGHELTADDVASIGYLPEERGLYKKMKVGEQAIFFARLKGMTKRDAEQSLHQWFEKFEISDWWNKKVEELSKGMAQKVQFIVTVLHRPKLLIFDEPFSGFDPINANLLKNEIMELHKQGSTVIFSTHNMASVDALCDEITLINDSRNILSGNVAEIRRREWGNRYSIQFSGDAGEVMRRSAPLTDRFDLLPAETDGLHTAVIVPAAGGAIRPVIQEINSCSDILSIQPVMPTMEDIFISTVNTYNAKHNINVEQ
ncbi:MAG: ATP-binding cassette domain-containing protein [Muribaculaceae bacterium]|nr:ATP-binding cassette domain-containing protein [Muribaculaceae bacterium]